MSPQGPSTDQVLTAIAGNVATPAFAAGPQGSSTALARELELKRYLHAQGSALVAFSGGVDSSYLLAVAHEVLGSHVLAVTADSPSLSREALERARTFCQVRGIRHQVVETDEFSQEEYRLNSGNRCYHCKSALLTAMNALQGAWRQEHGPSVLLIGAIAEDLGDHRPGMRAAAEGGARWPMADLGFTKAQVRERSQSRGLPTWDLPAQPCLSSRVPYGESVTPEAVRMIEAAEVVLHGLGFPDSRARHHGVGRAADGSPRGFLCRIEVPESELSRLLSCRERLIPMIRAIGYVSVTLDLAGLVSGGLNVLLSKADRNQRA
jgi:uncharacterized protein